eukprot:1797683-Alexandrium_andersonii.AAC.1
MVLEGHCSTEPRVAKQLVSNAAVLCNDRGEQAGWTLADVDAVLNGVDRRLMLPARTWQYIDYRVAKHLWKPPPTCVASGGA